MPRTSRLGAALACSILLLTAPLAVADPPRDDYRERMAVEHADDSPVASPMVAEATEGGPLETIEVEYAILDGKPVKGYLARPEMGDIDAAVIVIHEWWGLNDNIRAMAERLAAEGWAALAVDLYEGEVGEDREAARRLATAARENPDRGASNIRQAREWLGNELGVERVGVIGWCFGGGWSLQTALMLGDAIDAAVIYYGRVESDPEALAPLTAPVMGHFGSEDDGIPLKPADIFVYEGADHAFANPSGTRFDADAAIAAWGRTTEFFHAQLDG